MPGVLILLNILLNTEKNLLFQNSINGLQYMQISKKNPPINYVVLKIISFCIGETSEPLDDLFKGLYRNVLSYKVMQHHRNALHQFSASCLYLCPPICPKSAASSLYLSEKINGEKKMFFFPNTGDVYLLLEAYVCVTPEDVLHIATVELCACVTL